MLRERERESARLASALTKECAAQKRAGLVSDWHALVQCEASVLTKECAAQRRGGECVSDWHSLVQCLASVLTKEYAAQGRMRLDQTKSLVD